MFEFIYQHKIHLTKINMIYIKTIIRMYIKYIIIFTIENKIN